MTPPSDSARPATFHMPRYSPIRIGCSPTAARDLQHFHDAFSPSLPNPNFAQVFPQGNPQYNNTCTSNGLSGPCAAANWSGEATLDIEWAYAIAPLAHIVLLAVPPAETLGVQGFPNLFNAISGEINATPPGTVFSMSLAATEQTFGGAAATQTARFDQVFQAGLAKHDNFFAASGDFGSLGISKQHKESGTYSTPTAWWPASSPYVVSVGGTQLQHGWTWNPSSNNAFTSSGAFNPAYWASTSGGNSQAMWNESWTPIATGGGASVIYRRPVWQLSCGATALTATGGTATFVFHESTDAQGIFHLTGTGTFNRATFQDAAGNTYSVSGAKWFGGSAYDPDANEPIAFTSMDKFVIRTATGGVFGMVNVTEHISPNGTYFEFDFGDCSD